jgi:hypothetical protein
MPGPMDEDDKRRLVLKLVAQLRCSGCGRTYDPHDFALVGHRMDVWTLGVECRHCGRSSYVVVLMRLNDRPEASGDPASEGLESVDQLPPITADDVLDVYELLEEFDGDFDELFSA